MVAAGRTNLLEALAARRPSSAPPSEHLQNFAGVRERAGRGLVERDRVRARNDQRCARSCRAFCFYQAGKLSTLREEGP